MTLESEISRLEQNLGRQLRKYEIMNYHQLGFYFPESGGISIIKATINSTEKQLQAQLEFTNEILEASKI
jgi:hypothetical protein